MIKINTEPVAMAIYNTEPNQATGTESTFQECKSTYLVQGDAAFNASVQLLIDIRGMELKEIKPNEYSHVYVIRWLKQILEDKP